MALFKGSIIHDQCFVEYHPWNFGQQQTLNKVLKHYHQIYQLIIWLFNFDAHIGGIKKSVLCELFAHNTWSGALWQQSTASIA